MDVQNSSCSIVGGGHLRQIVLVDGILEVVKNM
jgi:hypothetical protein